MSKLTDERSVAIQRQSTYEVEGKYKKWIDEYESKK